MMGLVNIVLFAALFTSGYAGVVRTLPCEDTNEICSIGEVRIEPWTGPRTCTINRGTNVSVTFDFTPNFSTSKLQTLVWWDHVGTELPIYAFGSTDACTYTACPTVAGQTQTLNYNVQLSLKLPMITWVLKWKIWDEDRKNETCCFKFHVRVKREKKVKKYAAFLEKAKVGAAELPYVGEDKLRALDIPLGPRRMLTEADIHQDMHRMSRDDHHNTTTTMAIV